MNLIFDTGPIITLVTNNLLNVLVELKKNFEGEFHLSKNVKHELIDYPLKTRKFKFAALYVQTAINKGLFKVYTGDLEAKKNLLFNLANSIFRVKNKYIKIVDKAEMETLALASELNGVAVIDERTARLLIENPKKLAKLLSNKLHSRVLFDIKALRNFQKALGKLRVIRSIELIVVAYEKGLLDKYVVHDKKELLDALLWGLRLKGAAISSGEIKSIMKLEGF